MRSFPLLVIATALRLAPAVIAAAPAAEHGMVATVNPIATQAGVNAVKAGGNAVDAAVAAALTLGVVDGYNSGIGGGCFLLIRTPSGEFFAIDGRETAPKSAKRDMFIRDGKANPKLSQEGSLASGVPGALAAYELALKRWGKLPLKTHLLAAADIAEKGFPVSAEYASRLKGAAEELNKYDASRAIFLKSDGKPWAENEVLVQKDLAATYRNIAEAGTDWFYKGPFAETAGVWMENNGGILKSSDFKSYEAKLRAPVRSTYRGCEVISFPPPSSGGALALEILNIVENFDLAKMGRNSADSVHVIAESMKAAFADRAHWFGDPDFITVPTAGLISKDYAKSLAAKIDLAAARKDVIHGDPSNPAAAAAATPSATSTPPSVPAAPAGGGKHTTHLSAADHNGFWVACTATINTTFGSKVIVPGTGVMLNNEMDDFSIQPGVPNAFGLVGGDANAIAPAKRPLSSMSPTIVLKDGQPILAVGAAGGPTIISQTVMAIVNTVDFQLPVDEAIAGTRVHHQWKPDEVKVEKSLPAEVLEALRQRGHTLDEVKAFGACQAVARDPKTGQFTGAADPRVGGSAAGW